ncbi:MAG: stationary phase survival protein SurE [uncultured bacterium]|nr:MAG: stationary phase survival protein SurE [uncultured bacterium]HLD44886.1 5'/3'-nucleotidase SurE [bacterium]
MIDVLVTNDDGVEAKGIKALAKVLGGCRGVRVTVVAPRHEQSSTSHAISLRTPLRISKVKPNVYAVEGTPIDAVFAGVWIILKKKPDFIFSGINRGGNLGDDVHYSGTVSAAMEGGLLGVPSVAISQLGKTEFDYTQSAAFARIMLEKVRKHTLPAGVVLNVNVPEKANLCHYAVTKTGQRDYGGKYIEQRDPRGAPYYWIGGDQYKHISMKGSDCDAVFSGKISITPLQVDITSYGHIETVRNWF